VLPIRTFCHLSLRPLIRCAGFDLAGHRKRAKTDRAAGGEDGLLVTYFVLKFLHVIGATVILGTGAGIAFFMLMAHVSRDAAFVARTARVVVLADYLFTATAIVAQPLTGYLLVREIGLPLLEGWLVASYVLYVIAGLFWLPVVWMQIRMRDLAAVAAASAEPLPAAYHRLFRLWFAFGFPGFGSVLAIVWLMIAKPHL
jgi:uncharacterized membrane protein